MLKSLSLQNFRSHKNSILNFHPGVNVIVGLSRSGKTNIFRGLRWLCFFRPTGDSIVSDFIKLKELTEVELKTDSDVVSLTKKDKTYYKINGNQLSGFGSTIPIEITKALNITDLNIQEQIDEHFLITKSPGEVAKVINEIIRIEKADQYISSLTTEINSTNHKVSILEDQNKVTKKSINELEYIDGLKEMVDKWFKLDICYLQITNDMDAIKSSLKEIETIEKDNKFLSEVIKELDQELNNYIQLFNYSVTMSDSIEIFKQATSFKEKYNQGDIDKLEKLIIEGSKLFNLYKIQENDIETIDGLLYKLTSSDELLDNIEGSIKGKTKQAEKSVDNYILSLKENKECPTCGGIIDDKCIQKERKKLLADLKIND